MLTLGKAEGEAMWERAIQFLQRFCESNMTSEESFSSVQILIL